MVVQDRIIEVLVQKIIVYAQMSGLIQIQKINGNHAIANKLV